MTPFLEDLTNTDQPAIALVKQGGKPNPYLKFSGALRLTLCEEQLPAAQLPASRSSGHGNTGTTEMLFLGEPSINLSL